MTLPQVGASRGSAVHPSMRPSEAAGAGDVWPSEVAPAERDPARKLTTFSHSTGEVTQHLARTRFKPVYAVALLVGLAVGVSGLLFLRPGSPPAPPVPTLPTPPPTVVVPLPEPAPVPVPAVAPSPAPTPVRAGKGKAASENAKLAPTENASKRKGLKSQPKRRIFEEL
jgi:hypothetical protein